jgi:hypothetical protein
MGYTELSCDTGKPYRWGMPQSFCQSQGAIVSFVKTLAEQIKPSATVVIPACDGLAHADASEGLDTAPTWRLDFAYPSQARAELDALAPDAIGALCTRNYTDPRIVYLPLDDRTFVSGLQGIPSVPWESKSPIAFWRGGTSGTPFVRKALVERVRENPWCDAKFVDHYGSRGIPGGDFAPEVGLDTFVRHKYIVIIDGAVISSSHQWVFGSGSVPILITHPLNHFWFKSHLKPWVNYVPVSYSLADLEPTLQWLRDHDAEAKRIAVAAMDLARTVFSPSYQREYLTRELERVLVPSIRYNLRSAPESSTLDAPQETQAPPATIPSESLPGEHPSRC